jgi:hypothetical protein
MPKADVTCNRKSKIVIHKTDDLKMVLALSACGCATGTAPQVRFGGIVQNSHWNHSWIPLSSNDAIPEVQTAGRNGTFGRCFHKDRLGSSAVNERRGRYVPFAGPDIGTPDAAGRFAHTLGWEHCQREMARSSYCARISQIPAKFWLHSPVSN